MDFETENTEELMDFLLAEDEEPDLFGQVLIQNQKEKEKSGSFPTRDEEFHPAEVAYLLDNAVSQITNVKAGFFAGVCYQQTIYLLALGVIGGLTYLLSSGDPSPTYLSLSLLAISVGTFILMAGSNLIENFDEERLNFRAYVHNAITFIGSGMAILASYVLQILNRSVAGGAFYSIILDVSILLITIGGSLLLVLSIWVLLKLLWRLNQLIFWSEEYANQRSVYSELIAPLIGFFIAGGSPIGVVINTFLNFAIIGVVYYFTNDLILAVLVFFLFLIARIAFAISQTEVPSEIAE